MHENKPMETESKKQDQRTKQQDDGAVPQTVRGSGYTYDEESHPTDESIPKQNVDGEPIVKLPDLGKPGTM